jgi:hypothetical protein
MWSLDNRTVFAADRNWIRDKNGAHHWLVAVRATFDIGPEGRISLADAQTPPLSQPEFRGDPGSSSLRVDADLVAWKPATDVVVDASAHAPDGKATGVVPVSLRIGDVEKALLVFGTRVHYRGAFGPALSAPQPFVRRLIHYEWAFGGMDRSDPHQHRLDLRNPVGRGFALDPRTLENQPAHAIEYPNRNAAEAGPAGFGPIASFWSPRVERAGTYDDRWRRSIKPLLPDDYDDRFALSAPDDQRPSRELRGGETISLVNLTEAGALRLDLPKIFLVFRSRFGSRSVEHRASLATVLVSLEEMKLILVWQSALRVPAREAEYLDSTLIQEKPYLG